MKIFSARGWEMEPTGSLCQMVHTAWEPPVKSACWQKRAVSLHYQRGKEKRRLGSDFERKGAGGADDDEGVSTLRHACVRAGEQRPRGGTMAINSPLGLCEDGFLRL